jgi:hypothetical protein
MEESAVAALRSLATLLTAVSVAHAVGLVILGMAFTFFAARVRRLEVAVDRLTTTLGEVVKDLVRVSEHQRWQDHEQNKPG